MHVLIQTAGSSGDVHPFIGLGRVLAARGHDVEILANEVFGDLVRDAGVTFTQLGSAADYERLKSDPELWHPRKGARFVFERAVMPYLRPAFQVIREQVRPGETLLITSSLGLSARLVAEVDGVPLVTAHLAPSLFRSVHAMPQFGGFVMPDWAPSLLRHGFWWVADKVIDPAICPPLNALRAELGLRKVKRPFESWIHQGDGLLGLFPDWFGPPQPDWPEGLVCTGFPLFDDGEIEPVDPELDVWLSVGDPPLLFTHGSANCHARAFFETSVRAAQALGRRALLVAISPDNIPAELPEGMLHVTSAPFSQVFQRCGAVIHHGGIGTTAQGLAAGVPQLIVPMAFDQFDNGARVMDLEVGDMLHASSYELDSALPVLERLVTDRSVTQRARRIAQRLVEDRPARAVASREIERVAEYRGVFKRSALAF